MNPAEAPTIHEHVIPRRHITCEATTLETATAIAATATDCTTTQSIQVETQSHLGGTSCESTTYTNVVFDKDATQNQTAVNELQETLTKYVNVILPAKTRVAADCTSSRNSILAGNSRKSTDYTSVVFAKPPATATNPIKSRTLSASKYEDVIHPSNKTVKASMPKVSTAQQQEKSQAFAIAAEIVLRKSSRNPDTVESSPRNSHSRISITPAEYRCIPLTDLQVEKLVASG